MSYRSNFETFGNFRISKRVGMNFQDFSETNTYVLLDVRMKINYMKKEAFGGVRWRFPSSIRSTAGWVAKCDQRRREKTNLVRSSTNGTFQICDIICLHGTINHSLQNGGRLFQKRNDTSQKSNPPEVESQRLLATKRVVLCNSLAQRLLGFKSHFYRLFEGQFPYLCVWNTGGRTNCVGVSHVQAA